MNSFTVRSGKTEIYTEYFGDRSNSNKSILLISGTATPARLWIDEFCLELAGAGYFVVRYDHRDVGLSSSVNYSQNPYTMDDLAKDAISVLDAYKIDNAHIIGHSMGGLLAQLIAINHPSRVLSITLVSTMVLANAEMNEEEKNKINSVMPVLMKNKPTKDYEVSVGLFLDSFDYFHGDIPVEKDIAISYVKDMYVRSSNECRKWLGDVEPHNHIKSQHGITDRTSELKSVISPVFIIHGQNDILISPRIVKKCCADFLPNVKSNILTDMGHMVLSRKLFQQIAKIILANFSSI